MKRDQYSVGSDQRVGSQNLAHTHTHTTTNNNNTTTTTTTTTPSFVMDEVAISSVYAKNNSFFIFFLKTGSSILEVTAFDVAVLC